MNSLEICTHCLVDNKSFNDKRMDLTLNSWKPSCEFWNNIASDGKRGPTKKCPYFLEHVIFESDRYCCNTLENKNDLIPLYKAVCDGDALAVSRNDRECVVLFLSKNIYDLTEFEFTGYELNYLYFFNRDKFNRDNDVSYKRLDRHICHYTSIEQIKMFGRLIDVLF